MDQTVSRCPPPLRTPVAARQKTVTDRWSTRDGEIAAVGYRATRWWRRVV